jgi:ribosomal-protein-alanine N-acetyltransferase
MFIRKMNELDIDAVSDMELDDVVVPWRRQTYVDCLQHYDCFVLENEQNGEVVGYGIVYIALGESHLLNIAIAKNYRKHGFGRQILEYLFSHSIGKGAAVMLLEVRKTNDIAINLYKKHFNFTEIGTRDNYYNTKTGTGLEDALVLRAELR